MGIIGWIIIGGLAGWIASKIMNTDEQQGIILNIVVGIIGAFIGGWLLSLANIDGTSGILVSFLTALLGACLLLFVVKAVTTARLTPGRSPAAGRADTPSPTREAACSRAVSDFGADHPLR